MKPSNHLAVFLFFVMSSMPGQAATFCVGNGAELQQALITSANNGGGDAIHLREGLFSASSGLDAFTYVSPNHEPVDLIGGYSSPGGVPCSKRTERARLTVLSGSNLRRVFSTSGASVRLFNLTIKDGFSASSGGGIRMEPSSGYSIVIGNVIFDGNKSESSGGALEIIADGGLTQILGSLFMNNQCRSNACAINGVFNATDPTTYFVFLGGNTVAGNKCSTGAPQTCVTGGVKLAGTARSLSYNNAFAYNGGFDLDIQGAIGALYNSNVPNRAGTFAPDIGSLALVDPWFSDQTEGNYRLRYGSLLIDSGTSSYFMPTYDLDGNSRWNVTFDMGAFERPFSQLFFDGFESN